MANKEGIELVKEDVLACFNIINNPFKDIDTYKNEDFRITDSYLPIGVVGVTINNKINIYQVLNIISLLL